MDQSPRSPANGLTERHPAVEDTILHDEPAPPVPALATQQILVAMRFSYFGLSGWQSDFSREKELLFDASRLDQRLWLAETVALASLRCQSDQNFHLFLLTSSDLPEWAMQRLSGICEALLSPGQYTIYARPAGRARKHLRLFQTDFFAHGKAIQVVLDDDDGLSSDFIATLRTELKALDHTPDMAAREAPFFISCANGYGLVFDDASPHGLSLYLHRYPYINLGLCMINAPDGENIFSIDHRAAPPKYGCKLIGGRPMFVRSVHGLNDSRATRTERWTVLDDWRTSREVIERFPYLNGARCSAKDGDFAPNSSG